MTTALDTVSPYEEAIRRLTARVFRRGGPHCKGTGGDDIPVGAHEVVYGWVDYYGGCWTGVDDKGRVVYVPDEGPGELPGCPDPATEPQP